MTGAAPRLDLAAIKARAEAATPGPWGWRPFAGNPENLCRIVVYPPVVPEWVVLADEIWKPEDAEHMAGMDPPTTLALVAEMERLTAERDALRAVVERSLALLVASKDWRKGSAMAERRLRAALSDAAS